MTKKAEDYKNIILTEEDYRGYYDNVLSKSETEDPRIKEMYKRRFIINKPMYAQAIANFFGVTIDYVLEVLAAQVLEVKRLKVKEMESGLTKDAERSTAAVKSDNLKTAEEDTLVTLTRKKLKVAPEEYIIGLQEIVEEVYRERPTDETIVEMSFGLNLRRTIYPPKQIMQTFAHIDEDMISNANKGFATLVANSLEGYNLDLIVIPEKEEKKSK